MIYPSILQLIGKTPMVRLDKLKQALNLKANIIAKLESFNPGGSAKDRIALAMINDAEKKNLITKGGTIIEPTSGNTGIGLALVTAYKGYKLILTMPETMSEERQKLLAAYGAKIILTPGTKGMEGAIMKAEELAEYIDNSLILRQFENAANPDIHTTTTAEEIWADTEGNIDILVASVGTGGTLSGTALGLKKHDPQIQTVAVEPANSAVLSGGTPGKHNIQGIGAGFVPKNFNSNVVDIITTVEDSDAYKATKLILRNEGIFVGISSGAALHTAIELAQNEENRDKNIVVILPDTGERYLSTGVFQQP